MGNRTAFIGHSRVLDKDITAKLYTAIEEEIRRGCNVFTMGTRGDFDKQALNVCRQLRQKYTKIKIEVAITSFTQIKPVIIPDKIFGDEIYTPYADVQTIMYDIESTHFKGRILESNKQMLDTCDTLICYVDENYKYASGALAAYNYANKKGLRIVNLYNLHKPK